MVALPKRQLRHEHFRTVRQHARRAAFAITDRKDEGDSICFALASAWMNDPSIWEDMEEDYLQERKKMRSNGKSQETRTQIAAFIAANQGCTAHEIAKGTGLARHKVNYHLTPLCRDGDVSKARDGRHITYTLSGAPLQRVPQPEPPAPTRPQIASRTRWQDKIEFLAEWEGVSPDELVARLLQSYRGK